MRLLQVVVVASIGGLLCGYDRSLLGGALLLISRDFRLSLSGLGWVGGFLSLALLAGAVIGAAGAGLLADRLGRKPAMLWTAAAFAVGALLSAGAFNFGIPDTLLPTVFLLLDGRLVQGIAIGMSSVIVPLYLAEIAPAATRGMIVLPFVLAISVGTLAATLAPAVFADMPGTWRDMFGVGAVVAAAWGLGMWLQPESPRWLAGDNRLADAERILRDVQGGAKGDEEGAGLRGIPDGLRQATYTPLFGAPFLGVPIIVGSGLALLQQISGVNSVIWYAPTILRRAGLTLANAWTGSANAAVALVAVIIAILLVDRIGRRTLLLAGLGAMTVGLGFLSLAVGPVSGVGPLAVAIVLFGFGLGLGPMFWLLAAELFPFAYRGRGMSLAAATYWASKLLIAVVWPYADLRVLPGGMFALFGLVCGAGVVFVYRLVPETKGRSLEQIESELSGQAAVT